MKILLPALMLASVLLAAPRQAHSYTSFVQAQGGGLFATEGGDDGYSAGFSGGLWLSKHWGFEASLLFPISVIPGDAPLLFDLQGLFRLPLSSFEPFVSAGVGGVISEVQTGIFAGDRFANPSFVVGGGCFYDLKPWLYLGPVVNYRIVSDVDDLVEASFVIGFKFDSSPHEGTP